MTIPKINSSAGPTTFPSRNCGTWRLESSLLESRKSAPMCICEARAIAETSRKRASCCCETRHTGMYGGNVWRMKTRCLLTLHVVVVVVVAWSPRGRDPIHEMSLMADRRVQALTTTGWHPNFPGPPLWHVHWEKGQILVSWEYKLF